MNSRKALRQTILLRDEYLSQHHAGVMFFAGMVAVQFCPELAHVVFSAAALHDVGKVGIPEKILFKPGKLSDNEWLIIRQHPLTGSELVWRGNGDMGLNGDLDAVVRAIKHHHERWDGTGYPDGLVGEKIPLAARIIAVADAFDAMTTDRPYRKAMSKEEALKEIIKYSGRQFDLDIVNIFRKNVL